MSNKIETALVTRATAKLEEEIKAELEKSDPAPERAKAILLGEPKVDDSHEPENTEQS